MSELFTVEEINLIGIFDTGTRNALIAELIDATGFFEDEELLEIAVSSLEKLSQMSDADFAALGIYPDYGDDE